MALNVKLLKRLFKTVPVKVKESSAIVTESAHDNAASDETNLEEPVFEPKEEVIAKHIPLKEFV